ncbi:anti-sigma regulatory factor [Phytomonospora endophytica]|uniref:Serine/threonine-protein kinase RsbW n=1 Tax=Phytomonospora endophytica TaxID=714109 RepID=A0A841FHJ5_9ACTN|nr:anti-sigma regulatory factor [Phytomonospora endophytica]MBB6033042.1 serine/threonine-protein kinase RsbW [Phytomonospora endophytica]GIG65269.1 anti-sigma regulatory factor [Phytomonospora endophytica]
MDEAEVIEVQVPVDPAYLAVLRTAAAGLATRLRFTLGEIEDLRIAVDEAAAMLIAGGGKGPSGGGIAPGAEMTCRFDVTEADVTVSVSVPGTGRLLGTDTIPWRVLNALTGTVSTRESESSTTITLVKNRTDGND